MRQTKPDGVLKLAEVGAKKAAGPEILGAAGGMVGGWLAEKTLLTMGRPVFGTNDGTTPLSPQQRSARLALNVALAIAGGAIAATAKDKALKGAGVGLAAVQIKHLVEAAGIRF